MAIFFDENDVARLDGVAGWQLGSTATWENIDLDDAYGSLPANTSGAILSFNNEAGGPRNIGARPGSDTDFTLTSDLNSETQTRCFVKCDANKTIDVYREGSNTEVYLLGYFTTDGTWLDAPSDVTPGSTGWQTVSLSGAGASDIFAVFEVDTTITRAVNFRYAGAADNRFLTRTIGHHWIICPIDGSDQVDINCESIVDSTIYLVGFLSAGTIRTTGGSDLAPGTTGSYQNVTIPDTGNSHEIALIEVFNNGTTNYQFAMQPDGSSSYPDIYKSSRQHSGIWPIDLQEGIADIFEAKVEHADIELYCWGYLADVAIGALSINVSEILNQSETLD